MALGETLKAAADPVRRQILDLLGQSSMSAGEISARFSISDAAISRHLSILKQADLVRSYRKGQHIIYELNASVLDEIVIWISRIQDQTQSERKTEQEVYESRPH